LKVLVVDDNEDSRFLLRKRLGGKRQFQIVGEASNGAEAVDLVQELEPDIVIMDVRMPAMDGVEATRRIKERFPDTSVLAYSGFRDLEQMDAMREAGAVGYVLKDAPAEELIMRLQDSAAQDPAQSFTTSKGGAMPA
jgi:DNA-binding NarL/FixJ family response regulator